MLLQDRRDFADQLPLKARWPGLSAIKVLKLFKFPYITKIDISGFTSIYVIFKKHSMSSGYYLLKIRNIIDTLKYILEIYPNITFSRIIYNFIFSYET